MLVVWEAAQHAWARCGSKQCGSVPRRRRGNRMGDVIARAAIQRPGRRSHRRSRATRSPRAASEVRTTRALRTRNAIASGPESHPGNRGQVALTWAAARATSAVTGSCPEPRPTRDSIPAEEPGPARDPIPAEEPGPERTQGERGPGRGMAGQGRRRAVDRRIPPDARTARVREAIRGGDDASRDGRELRGFDRAELLGTGLVVHGIPCVRGERPLCRGRETTHAVLLIDCCWSRTAAIAASAPALDSWNVVDIESELETNARPEVGKLPCRECGCGRSDASACLAKCGAALVGCRRMDRARRAATTPARQRLWAVGVASVPRHETRAAIIANDKSPWLAPARRHRTRVPVGG